MPESVTYKRFGERAIIIEWPAVIDEKMLTEIILFKEKTKQTLTAKIRDYIIGYNSLTVVYDGFVKDIDKEIELLKSIKPTITPDLKDDSKIWNIPVCYDESFGIDLEEMSRRLKLSKQDIIDKHTKPVYTVFFIGFLPGFMYLGGLDDKLCMPRKENPRLKVEKGSVGVGGSQTGIYPSESAGGWNIIGKTPIVLFDVKQKEPAFVRSGDHIQFKPISLEEFKAIENDSTLKYQFFSHG